mgnify:CR=1 FL=1
MAAMMAGSLTGAEQPQGLRVAVSPRGRVHVEQGDGGWDAPARVRRAFEKGTAAGIVHLATEELQAALPAEWDFLRGVGRRYFTALSRQAGAAGEGIPEVALPGAEELAFWAMGAPPLLGQEYLNGEVLQRLWGEVEAEVRGEIAQHGGAAAAWLREKHPVWRLVGRVTFHLAENKRDPARPFAFMATYTQRVSSSGQVQHSPLKNALEEHALAKDRQALVSLLTPVQRAAEKSAWAKELVESRRLYEAQKWTATDAYHFLREVPTLEESGIVVRVPDWWKRKNPSRPMVSVRIGEGAPSRVGVDALLDFQVETMLDGETLTAEELRALRTGESGLVRVKGQWVEFDKAKFEEALTHWKNAERLAKEGMTFAESMRLLAGMPPEGGAAAAAETAARQWTGITPGAYLDKTLQGLRSPEAEAPPAGLRATLRPYQAAGVRWLGFVTGLGLGGCLADDMGLGKTVQVLGLLLKLREAGARKPSLLVVPTSLIANWTAEREKFAPDLRIHVAHPSAEGGTAVPRAEALSACDAVITSYGMLSRLEWLAKQEWGMVILDEAQAIKNAGSKQARAVKELRAGARVAMTGTPIENRLGDLWSLFDFLNPGLLGGAKAFERYVKGLAREEQASYAPLRALVGPYILRRLKTDRRIIADLPEKTEVQAWCGLSVKQAALYQEAVKALKRELENADGVQRRGIILASLMRFKQICNHPSHWLGDGMWAARDSGKFERLQALCEEMAQRQEKVLVFTQFREMTEPLAAVLREIFGREGLVLHGATAVGKRREMVEGFARDEGPPFFVLSLKAGGVGLNLTAASQVIHFDRWWNPAVENQATDRAFRIGQKKNVLVHKFVCRGTVEERIDALIADKRELAADMLDSGGGAAVKLTEMGTQELLRFVALDIDKAGGG